MLVYTRQLASGKVLFPVNYYDIPDHLHKRFEAERQKREELSKSALEVHLNLSIKIVPLAVVQQHNGFDVVDLNPLSYIRFKRLDTVDTFKTYVQSNFGISKNSQRYWLFEQRINRTIRPSIHVPLPLSDDVSIEKVFDINPKSVDPSIVVYVHDDEQVEWLMRPFTANTNNTLTSITESCDSWCSSFDTFSNVLLVFKVYDCNTRTFKILDCKPVSVDTQIQQLFVQIIDMCPTIDLNGVLHVYEEVRPSIIEPLNAALTVEQARLEQGDILVFHTPPPPLPPTTLPTTTTTVATGITNAPFNTTQGCCPVQQQPNCTWPSLGLVGNNGHSLRLRGGGGGKGYRAQVAAFSKLWSALPTITTTTSCYPYPKAGSLPQSGSQQSIPSEAPNDSPTSSCSALSHNGNRKQHYMSCPELYHQLLNRITINFCPRAQPSKAVCSIEMDKDANISDVRNHLASYISMDPALILLIGQSADMDPRPLPFKQDATAARQLRLFEMLSINAQQFSNILYFELLQSKFAPTNSILNVDWYNVSQNKQVFTYTVIVPDSQSVHHVLLHLQNTYQVCDPKHIKAPPQPQLINGQPSHHHQLLDNGFGTVTSMLMPGGTPNTNGQADLLRTNSGLALGNINLGNPNPINNSATATTTTGGTTSQAGNNNNNTYYSTPTSATSSSVASTPEKKHSLLNSPSQPVQGPVGGLVAALKRGRQRGAQFPNDSPQQKASNEASSAMTVPTNPTTAATHHTVPQPPQQPPLVNNKRKSITDVDLLYNPKFGPQHFNDVMLTVNLPVSTVENEHGSVELHQPHQPHQPYTHHHQPNSTTHIAADDNARGAADNGTNVNSVYGTKSNNNNSGSSSRPPTPNNNSIVTSEELPPPTNSPVSIPAASFSATATGQSPVKSEKDNNKKKNLKYHHMRLMEVSKHHKRIVNVLSLTDSVLLLNDTQNFSLRAEEVPSSQLDCIPFVTGQPLPSLKEIPASLQPQCEGGTETSPHTSNGTVHPHTATTNSVVPTNPTGQSVSSQSSKDSACSVGSGGGVSSTNSGSNIAGSSSSGTTGSVSSSGLPLSNFVLTRHFRKRDDPNKIAAKLKYLIQVIHFYWKKDNKNSTMGSTLCGQGTPFLMLIAYNSTLATVKKKLIELYFKSRDKEVKELWKFHVVHNQDCTIKLLDDDKVIPKMMSVLDADSFTRRKEAPCLGIERPNEESNNITKADKGIKLKL